MKYKVDKPENRTVLLGATSLAKVLKKTLSLWAPTSHVILSLRNDVTLFQGTIENRMLTQYAKGLILVPDQGVSPETIVAWIHHLRNDLFLCLTEIIIVPTSYVSAQELQETSLFFEPAGGSVSYPLNKIPGHSILPLPLSLSELIAKVHEPQGISYGKWTALKVEGSVYTKVLDKVISLKEQYQDNLEALPQNAMRSIQELLSDPDTKADLTIRLSHLPEDMKNLPDIYDSLLLTQLESPQECWKALIGIDAILSYIFKKGALL